MLVREELSSPSPDTRPWILSGKFKLIHPNIRATIGLSWTKLWNAAAEAGFIVVKSAPGGKRFYLPDSTIPHYTLRNTQPTQPSPPTAPSSSLSANEVTSPSLGGQSALGAVEPPTSSNARHYFQALVQVLFEEYQKDKASGTFRAAGLKAIFTARHPEYLPRSGYKSWKKFYRAAMEAGFIRVLEIPGIPGKVLGLPVSSSVDLSGQDSPSTSRILF